ncbi:MAG: acyl-CoA dehydrogenase family protein [Desulfobacterales bacterium]
MEGISFSALPYRTTLKWVGPSLMLFGTEEQKKKYLPKIAAAEAEGVWCTGYSEPDSGSDLASLQTSAVRDGDEYVINGQKVWTSAGHRARYCWLACRTDPNAKRKHDGISIIIVDMKSEGVTVRPLYNIVGLHYFNEIFFKDVRVPAENLVGVENNGWAQLMRALAFERGVGLTNNCLSKRILDELVVFARENGSFQRREIRHKLAAIATDIQALKLMTLESEWKADRGDTIVAEPSRDKAYNDDIWERLSQVGTEILGSYAEVDPLALQSKWTKAKGMVESLYWGAPGMAIAAGTVDTMKNIVAQFGIGLPKPY